MKTKPRIEIDLKQVEALAGCGLNKEQISNALGFLYRTFNRNQKVKSELVDAYKRGKAKAIGVIANTLFKQAKGGNLTAIIFYLKTQAGWSDRIDINANVKQDVDVDVDATVKLEGVEGWEKVFKKMKPPKS